MAYVSKQEQLGHLWLAEAARFEYDQDDWEAAECADLAEELAHHEVLALVDPDFDDKLGHWHSFIEEYELRLPLEQSCYEGILLPLGQRAIRIQSCPESMRYPLFRFFKECPAYIASYVALYNSVLVRVDRARRTGNPDWRPASAQPAPETDRAFFRPPVLKFRNYAR